MNVRKITKNGAVTLPKTIRAEAGLFPGNGVELSVNEDGSVTIKPVIPCCHFCGSPEEVSTVENMRICRACAAKVIEKVGVTE
jgi:transcriptional pleiotropic regulator of transition state genes